MLRRKVVLVINNAPCHPPNVKLSAVKLVFLPLYTTAKTQPMDQGVIRSFKANYRHEFIMKALVDPKHTAPDCKWSILDALYTLMRFYRKRGLQ